MFTLDSDEKSFLRDHHILETELFDAEGMTGAQFKPIMKSLDLDFCVGKPCQKAGHRIRSRSNHCIQCDHAKIAFQRRWNKPGQVYVAFARTSKLVKVGTADRADERVATLNSFKYGGECDWEITCLKKCASAGRVEHLAQSKLEQYRQPGKYFKDDQWRDCYELFRCSRQEATQAVMEAIAEFT